MTYDFPEQNASLTSQFGYSDGLSLMLSLYYSDETFSRATKLKPCYRVSMLKMPGLNEPLYFRTLRNFDVSKISRFQNLAQRDMLHFALLVVAVLILRLGSSCQFSQSVE